MASLNARAKAHRDYARILAAATSDAARTEAMRALVLGDLFYLLVHVLGRTDVDRDWLFERCREVEAAPNGCIDLWAREHYKSTIITFAKTIQDVLADPETTVGIFSHTRTIARGFLRQIKRELEGNTGLKALFPDVLYQAPSRRAPKWSEDDGLIVKRRGNPKESTIEAWGLVDGQPTGRHFRLMVYDDVVTRESVTSPVFEQQRFLLPETCMRRNHAGISEDLTRAFVQEEYLPFPVATHDDMLDGLSRILDPNFSVVAPDDRRSGGGTRSESVYDPHRW